MSNSIKIAIAGVGNCASSLIQGIAYYAKRRAEAEPVGLLHPEIGGWRADDVQGVAALDVDARKVNRPLEDAIFAPPNNTRDIDRDLPRSGVIVQMGNTLDGCPPHMMK